MSVNDEYIDYILEQLEPLGDLSSKKMFGGIGFYSGGIFFALMTDDTLYFKVDESNQADYEEAGMQAFRYYSAHHKKDIFLHYYQVPIDIIENPDEIYDWAIKAKSVAIKTSKK